MTRTYSRDARVHRVLDRRLDGGPQRGDDVEQVIAATRKRLGARGYPDAAKPKRTHSLNGTATDAMADALYALGAAPATVSAARHGKVTKGGQRLIRYPGTRTPAQLNRAKARQHEVGDRVAEEKRRAAAHDEHHDVDEFRRRVTQAVEFSLRHSGRRYTQGPGRWVIAQHPNPTTGRMWTSGDCSGFATWAVFWGLGADADRSDIVNGQDWDAGFTGTMRVHGRRVTTGRYEPGDCAIYGGGSGEHTTVCWKAGTAATARWGSHGGPGGPRDLPLNYRSDLSEVRRYVG